MRALRLMQLPDICMYLDLLKTTVALRLVYVSCVFISVWLCAAGVTHLVA